MWENAGRERTYRITRRSFDTESTRPDAARSYRGKPDLELIWQVHEDEHYRVRRNQRQYNRLLGQSGLKTLVFDSGRPAYLCYRGEDPTSVLEFGGSREGVATLPEQVLETGTEIDIYTHLRHSLIPLFHDVAADWSLNPHRKLNIRDLPTLIDAYAPLFEERWSTVRDGLNADSGAVTLCIVDESRTTESVTISYDSSGVRIATAERDAEIELNRREMTHLVFGSVDVRRSIKRAHLFLAATPPLEYYFWQTETI